MAKRVRASQPYTTSPIPSQYSLWLATLSPMLCSLLWTWQIGAACRYVSDVIVFSPLFYSVPFMRNLPLILLVIFLLRTCLFSSTGYQFSRIISTRRTREKKILHPLRDLVLYFRIFYRSPKRERKEKRRKQEKKKKAKLESRRLNFPYRINS